MMKSSLISRELELNAFEDSDDLPMAPMTSSAAKPKTVSSTAQKSNNTCNYCKEKGNMVKDCEKLKKKKEKDAQQGKPTPKKTYPKRGICGKTNHPENDVGRAPARILNLSAPSTRIHLITIKIQKLQNPTINQHRPTPSLHPRKTIQKTSFAITPIQPTYLCSTIHQIGPSNKNYSWL